MKIVPFQPEHALTIDMQEWQADAVNEMSPTYAQSLAACGPAFTALDGDTVVACGGCAKMWADRHIIWTLLSKDARKHMTGVTRAGRRLLELQSGRIEAIVRSDFEQGHRWAKMCGMKFHHHEEKFLPGGRDADIYVRFV